MTPNDHAAMLSVLLYVHRRYIVLCAALLAFYLYALLLTAHGTVTPRFVLDPSTSSLQHASSSGWRRVSDMLAGRKYAVLTFDDGPYGYGLDEQIMATLRKHHAHAVFFLACSHINQTNRRVLGEFESEGDLIGNHGYDRQDLAKLSRPEIEHQIEACNQRLAQLTGKRPYYFRPPSGSTTPLVTQAAQSLGMKQMLWNANSEDSWVSSPDQILNFSMEQTEDQSILLLHEKPATAAVLDDLLTSLEQRGFQFVLPDQLSNNTAIN